MSATYSINKSYLTLSTIRYLSLSPHQYISLPLPPSLTITNTTTEDIGKNGKVESGDVAGNRTRRNKKMLEWMNEWIWNKRTRSSKAGTQESMLSKQQLTDNRTSISKSLLK